MGILLLQGKIEGNFYRNHKFPFDTNGKKNKLQAKNMKQIKKNKNCLQIFLGSICGPGPKKAPMEK